MATQKKAPAAKPADNTSYHIIIDLILVCIGVMLLQAVGRNVAMPDRFEYWLDVLGLWRWIFLAAAAVGAALAFVKIAVVRKAGIFLAAVAAVLAAASAALHTFAYVAMPYLYFFLIAGGALYLVWLLYPHDFFLIALLTTLAGGCFYRHGQSSGTGLAVVLFYLIVVLLIAASLLLGRKATRAGGVLTFGKKTLRLLSGKAGATPLYLTCSILLACIIAALLLGSSFAFYCVYAAVGGLFVAACYYTIRLN